MLSRRCEERSDEAMRARREPDVSGLLPPESQSQGVAMTAPQWPPGAHYNRRFEIFTSIFDY